MIQTNSWLTKHRIVQRDMGRTEDHARGWASRSDFQTQSGQLRKSLSLSLHSKALCRWAICQCNLLCYSYSLPLMNPSYSVQVRHGNTWLLEADHIPGRLGDILRAKLEKSLSAPLPLLLPHHKLGQFTKHWKKVKCWVATVKVQCCSPDPGWGGLKASPSLGAGEGAEAQAEDPVRPGTFSCSVRQVVITYK